MNTEQETVENTDTTFHIKSTKFMCNNCNRQFCVVSPENGQGKCPRCDTVSDTLCTEDDNGDTLSTEETESQNSESQGEAPTNPQTQEPTPSPQPLRTFSIVRRVIFRPGGIIVIETLLPVNENGAGGQSNQPQGGLNPFFQNEASQNGNHDANQSENASQDQQQGQGQQPRPSLDPLLFLLLNQLGLMDSDGFDRIIEEFLRDDPNHHGAAPASEENIKSLQEFEFDFENSKHTQCTVCQDDYSTGDKCYALPCDHNYHKDCIIEWLKLHDSCPICRKSISPIKTKETESRSPEQDTSTTNSTPEHTEV